MDAVKGTVSVISTDPPWKSLIYNGDIESLVWSIEFDFNVFY